jgi:hypothetical protein
MYIRKKVISTQRKYRHTLHTRTDLFLVWTSSGDKVKRVPLEDQCFSSWLYPYNKVLSPVMTFEGPGSFFIEVCPEGSGTHGLDSPFSHRSTHKAQIL